MQEVLFEIPEAIRQPKWDEKAVSLSFDENAIIRWIMELHNAGKPFDIDPTYSTGRFWDGLPKPRLKFDMSPSDMGSVSKADARFLPLKDGVVSSIMFDPPFVVAPSPKPGIIRDRFSCYKNITALWQFYLLAMHEFWRVLGGDGLLVVKCQDVVSSGKNWASHYEVMKYAEQTGFQFEDLFVLGRKNVLWSPNMENQKNARKNHCYFLVFRKPVNQSSVGIK